MANPFKHFFGKIRKTFTKQEAAKTLRFEMKARPPKEEKRRKKVTPAMVFGHGAVGFGTFSRCKSLARTQTIGHGIIARIN